MPSAGDQQHGVRVASIDSTDRFKIGRYEQTSVMSSPGFFAIGVRRASLNSAGKWPVASDRSKSATTNGAITSMISLSVSNRLPKFFPEVVERR